MSTSHNQKMFELIILKNFSCNNNTSQFYDRLLEIGCNHDTILFGEQTQHDRAIPKEVQKFHFVKKIDCNVLKFLEMDMHKL